MRRLLRHRFLVGAAAVALVGGAGGGAYAASQSGGDPQQALLNDVAKRLHVSPSALRSAIQGAYLDRLEADVKAGRITQAQANRIKRRIQRGGVPFGPPFALRGPWRRGFEVPRFGMRGFPPAPISAAAHYLGLSVPHLLRDMQGGESLAAVARAQHRSVSGLERAMVAAERARLDRAVGAGWLTKAEARRRLAALSSQIGNVVTHSPPHVAGPRWGPASGPGPFGTPPGA